MIIPLNIKIEVVKAYNEGATFVAIAKRFGINRATASQIVTDWLADNFGIDTATAVWLIRNIKE